jgi:eukaryotic-like serine/threonine-protein kinase
MGGLTTRQLSGKHERPKKAKQRSQLEPGAVLQDRYRVIGVLGAGGFSSVYQARDMRFPTVTRLCAIKEMINMALDPQMRELTTRSFEREASILATLEHPAIPDVFDYFSEEERSYLVLEFVRGKDMEAAMAEQTSAPDQASVLDWALQLCDVLEYLHNHKPQPVVFRDLKPSNIMLDPYGRIRLIDFGIAKVFQSGERGTMIGTEGYSPPEQYRGESGPAGDVYAFGATIHHLLTRQDPRMEPPFSFAERPITAVNPTVSASFNAVIMRCLSYNAADRFPDGTALKKALLMIAQPTHDAVRLEQLTIPKTEPAPAVTTSVATVELSQATAAPVKAPPEPAASSANDSSSVKPLWEFKCEDEIRSTAVVADNMVYVGAYDNNLYAINLENGSFIWKFPASDGIGSSPYVYGDSIFIGSADRHLYAIRRHNGRLNWRFAANGPIYSSPRADYDHVFFGSDDKHLYAVNVVSGRQAWKAPAESPVRSSPCLGKDHIFFGTEAGSAFCLDLAGQIRWQFQAKRAITSTPFVAEDMVFIGSLDSTVYALDVNSGWSIWRFRAQRPVISSPVVHQEMLYIGSADGNLYALDIYNGRKVWAYETQGQVSSSPAIWKDHIYFGSTDGHVYCLDLKRGDLCWRFQTKGLVISSPTIVNDVVYIGSTDHRLYALPA